MRNVRNALIVENDDGFYQLISHPGGVEIKEILVEGSWGERETYTLVDSLLVGHEYIDDLIKALRSMKNKTKTKKRKAKK